MHLPNFNFTMNVTREVNSMIYTPEISNESFYILQRIAWGMRMPVSVVMDIILRIVPLIIDRERVCNECMNKTICRNCPFSSENHKCSNDLIDKIMTKGEATL